MSRSKPYTSLYLFSGLILVQFVIFPFLEHATRAGKMFFLSALVLVLFIPLLHSGSRIRTSRWLILPFFSWAVFFFSAFSAHHPPEAFSFTGGLGIGILYLVLVTHFSGEDEDLFPLLIDALLIAGVFAALLGLYEYLSFLWTGPSRSMLVPYLLPPNFSFRVYGTYGQPNHFALFLQVVLLAFILRYVHFSEMNRRAPGNSLRFLPVFLAALVFFLTWSRAGLVSFACILGFLWVLVSRGRYLYESTEGRKELFRLSLCFAAAFLLSRGMHHLGADGGFTRSLGAVNIGSDGRFVFMTSSLLMFLDHPWLGVGLDNFKLVLPLYTLEAHDLLGFVPYEAMRHTNWSHNEFLQILAEGGVLAFAPLFVLLLLFLISLGRMYRGKYASLRPELLFCHLFLIPFLIHSLFSWPLRYPPLFFLFLTFAGLLLARFSLREVPFSDWGRRVLGVSLVAALLLVGFLVCQEVRLGIFLADVREAGTLEAKFATFEDLAGNPFIEYRTLSEGLPPLLKSAFEAWDPEVGRKLLPYAERSADLRSYTSQWYNLALLNGHLLRYDAARTAVRQAIEVQPTNEPAWQYLHRLNLLEASRKTGRPIDDFLPDHQKGMISPLELIHGRN